jgi:transcriptional regulator with XRE-family HTH domain
MRNERSQSAASLISAGHLPSELRINDPKEFVKQFRALLLRKLRELRGISARDASTTAGISASDLARLEEGNVSASDLSVLHSLAAMYRVDYPSLLSVFKLTERPRADDPLKLAAYHDPKADEETKKAMGEFLSLLKDKI